MKIENLMNIKNGILINRNHYWGSNMTEIQVDGLDHPIFLVEDKETPFFENIENLTDIKALNIRGNEYLSMSTYDICMTNNNDDPEVIHQRLRILHRLYMRHRIYIPPLKSYWKNVIQMRIGPPAEKNTLDQHDYGHRIWGKLPYPLPCKSCNEPVQRIATISMDDPVFKGQKFGRPDLNIVFCFSCMMYSSSVIFTDHSKDELSILDMAVEDFFDVFEKIPEHVLHIEKSSRKQGKNGKLGGKPKWIQSQEIPQCPECKDYMVFLCQIDSNDFVSFGDCGMLYTFLCEKCMITGSFIQSH